MVESSGGCVGHVRAGSGGRWPPRLSRAKAICGSVRGTSGHEAIRRRMVVVDSINPVQAVVSDRGSDPGRRGVRCCCDTALRTTTASGKADPSVQRRCGLNEVSANHRRSHLLEQIGPMQLGKRPSQAVLLARHGSAVEPCATQVAGSHPRPCGPLLEILAGRLVVLLLSTGRPPARSSPRQTTRNMIEHDACGPSCDCSYRSRFEPVCTPIRPGLRAGSDPGDDGPDRAPRDPERTGGHFRTNKGFGSSSRTLCPRLVVRPFDLNDRPLSRACCTCYLLSGTSGAPRAT